MRRYIICLCGFVVLFLPYPKNPKMEFIKILNSPFHTRYADYMVLKDTRDHVMQSVQEKINDFRNWHNVHCVSNHID